MSAIFVRNVVFQYPGTEGNATTTALRDVSSQIPSSSLVVIVGENGSGKTSMVKLLAGLYRPTSGSITVDGVNMQDYKAADLASATALLTQDHTIFPMSVAENIAVGDPDSVSDMETVKQAAKLGGAHGFIEKLPDSYDEVLQPCSTSHPTKYIATMESDLKEVMDEVEREKEISGLSNLPCVMAAGLYFYH